MGIGKKTGLSQSGKFEFSTMPLLNAKEAIGNIAVKEGY
jgi:hypothetical protein